MSEAISIKVPHADFDEASCENLRWNLTRTSEDAVLQARLVTLENFRSPLLVRD